MKAWRKIIIVIAMLALTGTGVGVAALGPSSHTNLATSDVIYQGEAVSDWAGYEVSTAGDINGDGYDDILVGAPKAGTRTAERPDGEGKAYLIMGHDPNAWPAKPVNLNRATTSFIGCAQGSRTGRQLAPAGDVNGDGLDDFLIVGALCVPGKHSQAFLFLGREKPDWGLDFRVDGEVNSFIGETKIDIGSMHVSSAGDVNGDHYDDFLITSSLDDEHGENAGQVYLILGDPLAPWGKNFHLSIADASFAGEGPESRAGRSAAAAGDVNNDGYDDFLVGALGKVYLILGRKSADWGMDFSLSMADASFLAETSEGELNNELGRHVAGVGDVNNDGLDDILFGAADNDQAGRDAGKTYLFLGRSGADWGKNLLVTNADAAFLGEYPLDLAGFQVSPAGDINGDGFSDFMIGAPHSALAGPVVGSAYLIHGQRSANWGLNYSLARANAIYIGEEKVVNAGYATAPAGDFNADGLDDILIGAYGYGGEDESMWVPGNAYLVISARFSYDLYLPITKR